MEPEPKVGLDLFGFTDGRRWVFNECVALQKNGDLAAQAAGGSYAASSNFSLTNLSQLLDVWCDENPWLKFTPKQVLQQAIHDFIKARKSFLEGAIKHPPGFQRVDDCVPTLRYPQSIKLNQESIFLPKIGWVKLRNSFGRGIPPGRLCNATIKFEHRHWWAIVLFEQTFELADVTPIDSLGIDYGVKNTLAQSTGIDLQAPLMTDEEEARLHFLERRVARCEQGSNRRAKAQVRVNRFKLRITRRIHDWRHKTTTRLAKNHGLIAVEDLALKNMMASAAGTVDAPGNMVAQKAGLNKALLEPGAGIIFQQLGYKQQWRGHAFLKVPPGRTSQRCPECGFVHPDNRKTRDRFCCIKCSHAAPADTVAAINVIWLAKEIYGGRTGRIYASEPPAPESTGSPTRVPHLRLIRGKGIPAKAAAA